MQGLCFNWYRDFNINTEFCTFDVVATMHECGRKGAGFVIKRDGIEILVNAFQYLHKKGQFILLNYFIIGRSSYFPS